MGARVPPPGEMFHRWNLQLGNLLKNEHRINHETAWYACVISAVAVEFPARHSHS